MRRWGMVFLLVVAQAAFAEEAPPVAAFETFLSTLDRGDAASISEAIDYYAAHLASVSQPERDYAGILFFDYVDDVVDAINDHIESLVRTDWQQTLDESAKLAPICEANGLIMRGCEQPFVEISDAARGTLFSHVTERMSAFHAAYYRMAQGNLGCECFLRRLQDVPGRLAEHEAYLKAFPGSPLQEKVERERRALLTAFITGGWCYGNELFPSGGDAASPEALEVYRRYADEQAGTPTGDVVKNYLDVLENSHFAFCREVYDFVAANSDGYTTSYDELSAMLYRQGDYR